MLCSIHYIQYSIPLRDLPEEVIRLIEKINIELQFLKEKPTKRWALGQL